MFISSSDIPETLSAGSSRAELQAPPICQKPYFSVTLSHVTSVISRSLFSFFFLGKRRLRSARTSLAPGTFLRPCKHCCAGFVHSRSPIQSDFYAVQFNDGTECPVHISDQEGDGVLVIRYRVRGEEDIPRYDIWDGGAFKCLCEMHMSGRVWNYRKTGQVVEIPGSNETCQLQMKSRRARCKNPSASGVLHGSWRALL